MDTNTEYSVTHVVVGYTIALVATNLAWVVVIGIIAAHMVH
jgi:hypothetical protein